MTEKRYFKKEWEEEYYIFDSTHISEEKVDKESEYTYDVFADAMAGDTVVERLNEQEDEIKRLKDELQNLQTFKKVLEFAEKDMEERADWQAYCEKEFEGL